MKEEDILARQSRPQFHSTFVPKTRDWRYATGVFQHDDFEDAPKDRSAWDTMDYDYQVHATRSRSGSGIGEDGSMSLDGVISASDTPQSIKSKLPPELSKTIAGIEPVKKKVKTGKRSRSTWQKKYRTFCGHIEGGKPGYEVFSLVARLRFSGKLIIEDAPLQTTTPSPPEHMPSVATLVRVEMFSGPHTPATARTAKTLHTPHRLDSIESVHTFPLFKRTWIDETQDFNMQEIRAKLRQPGTKVKEVGNNYGWYADAVPIDALLPPGVPLSAKEVNAYYPHHVRWKGMMLRLTNNDYRGPDMGGMQVSSHGPHKGRSGANEIYRLSSAAPPHFP
jgi:hypothetical protein